MASIVSAGTTSATALNMSADTSGVLQLASNNGVVALTITTGQAVGIGTTSPTSFGSNVKLVLSATGNDSNLFVVSGLSKALRFGTATGESTIQGVDQTAVASYQPVAIEGGGYIRFNTGSQGGGSTAERMRIDGNGYVTTPYRPAFLYGFAKASVTTATVISTNNGFTINTDRTAFQVGSNFSTTTGRFTAPVTGTYVFGMSMMRDNVSGTQLDFRIHKNGAGAASAYSRVYWGAYSTSYQQNAGTTIMQLTAGDFIEFVPSSGTYYNDDSFIFGYLLG